MTWVVRDYVRSKSKTEVSSYGYDHSPKMLKLARRIWKTLGQHECYSCYHSIDKLISSLDENNSQHIDILITLGHVLIQTRDDRQALSGFVNIIETCAHMSDCRVVAVDAKKYDRPAQFREGCERLVAAMEKEGLIVDNPHIVESEMWTVVRARRRA